MRQICINETNIDLTYVYFRVFLIDGTTPADSQDGNQPEVDIGNGWTSEYIGILENTGYGNYRAKLDPYTYSTIGTIIRSHYKHINTIDSYGEDIEVVASLAQVAIFNDQTEFSQNIINLSYVTLAEAEAYFSTRLFSDDWDDAAQKDKIKALMMATRDINQLNFFGEKLHPEQPLEFPRKKNHYPRANVEIILGPDVFETKNSVFEINQPKDKHFKALIPDAIKIACCEIAIKYLEGVDIEEEMENLTIESQRFSSVHETYNRVSVVEAYRAGINSQKAWTYIKPYLADPYQLKLTRVN